jgi:hypothetical protein
MVILDDSISINLKNRTIPTLQYVIFQDAQKLRISESSESFEAISEERWKKKSEKTKRKLLAKKTIFVYGGEIGRYGGVKEMKDADLSRILVVNRPLLAIGEYPFKRHKNDL